MFMNPSTFETDPEEFSIDFTWLNWANFDLEKGLACLVKGGCVWDRYFCVQAT